MQISYPPIVNRIATTNGGLSTVAGHGTVPAKTRDDMDYQDIGARLQDVRAAFGAESQKAWAEREGFNPTQWNNWETGTRRIPVDAAERLCDRYGLTLDWIYRGRRDGLSETAMKLL
jgi:hypothetical protein